MSTRSLIGIQNKNGSVNYIYCHSDGYLTGVGKTLLENYTNRKKIQRLINLGDISSLGEVVGRKHPFDLHDLYPGYWTNSEIRTKCDADPRQKYTRAYGRDRGEKDVGFKTVSSVGKFQKQDHGTEYWYYKAYRGEWKVSTGSNFSSLKWELEKELNSL